MARCLDRYVLDGNGSFSLELTDSYSSLEPLSPPSLSKYILSNLALFEEDRMQLPPVAHNFLKSKPN